MSPRSVCFDSEMFGTNLWMFQNVKCWFGEWFSSGFSPTTVPVNLCPSSGRNPSYGSRGDNPYSGVGFALASEWEKSHQRSCEAEALRGKNPCIIVRSSSEKSHQQSVLNGHRGACVITSKWEKSHIGTYKPSIGSN